MVSNGILSLRFGATDNTARLEAKNPHDLEKGNSGIKHGVCGRQWAQKATSELVEDEEVEGFQYQPTGSFSSVGYERVKSVCARYSQHDIVRLRPRIRLHDLNEGMFVFVMNSTLAARIKTIRIFANEYKLAEIDAKRLEIDNEKVDPQISMLFSESELADAWVRVRPRDSSFFTLYFSDFTPKRIFEPKEVPDHHLMTGEIAGY